LESDEKNVAHAAASNLAKRLECGAFTAALARATRQRVRKILRSLESGAEATALQTLARLLSAFGLRASVLECARPSGAFSRPHI
jgi:hypothetical protein